MLQQKLQSKTEALIIVSKELGRARAENDEFRELLFRPQMNPQFKFPKPIQCGSDNNSSESRDDIICLQSYQNNTITKHLVGLRADNKKLLNELTRLRQLLQERDEDVRLLRSQLKKNKLHADYQAVSVEAIQNLGAVSNSEKSKDVEEKAELVSKLENTSSKYSQMRLDLQV